MNILYQQLMTTGAGESTHVREVVNNLSSQGHDVILIGKGLTDFDSKTSVKPSISMRIMKNVFGSAIVLHELPKFIRTFATLLRKHRVIDLVYMRHDLFASGYFLARLFGIPVVKEVNGMVAEETRMRGQAGRISSWVIEKIERFNMPKADKIIVVTSRLKEVLQEDYGVPGEKIVVVPNGANTDLFQPMGATTAREELNLNPSNDYVCFVGALAKWQGIEYLVQSAPLVLQKCPNTRYLIVGDGATRQELVNLAEQLGVSDKLIFAGMIPYAEVPLYINASDVCVFPAAKNSRNDKMGGGSALKLHEYMACGRPVVTGNIEAVGQYVMDSGSGFVVDPRDAVEMAEAIITLLQNEQLRREMGERGRKVAVEKHSWARVAEQVAEVCQSVVKQ